MDNNKSLDKTVSLIVTLLNDIQMSHGAVFNTRALRLTINKIKRRASTEGICFLTKTLPKLGKAIDQALAGGLPLDAANLRLKPLINSKLPKLFGEFTSRVFSSSGLPLQDPCVSCVAALRQLSYSFYKYELDYADEERSAVVQKFERTEDDLTIVESDLQSCRKDYDRWLTEGHSRIPYITDKRDTSGPAACLFSRLVQPSLTSQHHMPGYTNTSQRAFGKTERFAGWYCGDRKKFLSYQHIRRARALLKRLFLSFNPKDITPRHGPGAVATKQQLWAKFEWSNVSANITDVYPLDEFFYSCLGHVCDRLDTISGIEQEDLPARVILVPKDSRGPRLISCEPVDYQWIQQGLGRAIVAHVESHYLTKDSVFFTNQLTNRFGALLGSSTGLYATLDLNEASDRVSTELVRLLFPDDLVRHLEACRSSSTVLPDGRILKLRKFAPMGSCLCFPIMALSIWAILAAGSLDAETRKGLAVYGDDVIVPTAHAANAIEQLESFGLKINRDKSCTSGFFRESCGMDAYKGVNVTPVRFRTVWSSTPSASVYTSWIAYANSMYDKHYYRTYDLIVGWLHQTYGDIPDDDMKLSCPSLRIVSADKRPKHRRNNKSLQKLEYYVRDIKSISVNKDIDGWSMLLRYFTEKQGRPLDPYVKPGASSIYMPEAPFAASLYTRRRTSMLVRRWR
jgi:hypothetical protein